MSIYTKEKVEIRLSERQLKLYLAFRNLSLNMVYIYNS